MILLTGRRVFSRGLPHHDPVRVSHVFEEVAGVGGNRADPQAPHQREQPPLIDHPHVHAHVHFPQFPVRYKHIV